MLTHFDLFFNLLVEPRSGCETLVLRLSVCSVCVPVCVSVRLSAMILKWHNIVNYKYTATPLYMRVDTPLGYFAIGI